MADIRPIDANALYELFDRLRDELIVGFYVNYVIEAAPTLDYVPQKQWISVKDRLPEESAIYLVVVKEKYVFESQWNYHVDAASNYGDYIDDYWDTFIDWDEGQEVHVTHWMPLPKLPKEE